MPGALHRAHRILNFLFIGSALVRWGLAVSSVQQQQRDADAASSLMRRERLVASDLATGGSGGHLFEQGQQALTQERPLPETGVEALGGVAEFGYGDADDGLPAQKREKDAAASLVGSAADLAAAEEALAKAFSGGGPGEVHAASAAAHAAFAAHKRAEEEKREALASAAAALSGADAAPEASTSAPTTADADEEASAAAAAAAQAEKEAVRQATELRAARALLGLPRTSCADIIAEAENSSTDASEEALQAICARHKLSSGACMYAMELLGDRPWGKWKVDMACKALGEPHERELRQAQSLLDRRHAGGTFAGADGSGLLENQGMSMLMAFDRALLPKAQLIKARSSCSYTPQTPRQSGATVLSCADNVKMHGGKYFILGREGSNSSGECIQVAAQTKDCSDALNESEEFDLYSVNDIEWGGSCPRPKDFCTGDGEVYSVRDCDGDLIPDPVCVGPDPGTLGFLASGEGGCQENWPGAECAPRQLKLAGADGRCMETQSSAPGCDVLAVSCNDDSEGQVWHFRGKFLMNRKTPFLCLQPGDGGKLTMEPCLFQENMYWYFDAHNHLRHHESSKLCVAVDKAGKLMVDESCGSPGKGLKVAFNPPHDCRWSDWGEWQACSVTCGEGVKRRQRFVAREMELGGKKCQGEYFETKQCITSLKCPIHCEFDEWKEWGPCSVSCAGGQMERLREVLVQAAWGGLQCNGSKKDIAVCNSQPCPGDCVWAPWGVFGACDRPCGVGQKFRERVIETHAKAGGRSCMCCSRETVDCNTHGCPTHCEWAGWGEWYDCPKSCGSSMTRRMRNVRIQASGGGFPCLGDPTEYIQCGMRPCPVNCMWMQWGDWTECTGTCGYKSNTKERSRSKTGPLHNGLPCSGPTSESLQCNSKNCPVDCTWDIWTEWTVCQKGMFKGVRNCFKQRFRKRATVQEMGGLDCVGKGQETKVCPKCPGAHEEGAPGLLDLGEALGESLSDAVDQVAVAAVEGLAAAVVGEKTDHRKDPPSIAAAQWFTPTILVSVILCICVCKCCKKPHHIDMEAVAQEVNASPRGSRSNSPERRFRPRRSSTTASTASSRQSRVLSDESVVPRTKSGKSVTIDPNVLKGLSDEPIGERKT